MGTSKDKSRVRKYGYVFVQLIVTHIRKYGEEKWRVKKDKTKGDKTSSTTYPTVGFFVYHGRKPCILERK